MTTILDLWCMEPISVGKFRVHVCLTFPDAISTQYTRGGISPLTQIFHMYTLEALHSMQCCRANCCLYTVLDSGILRKQFHVNPGRACFMRGSIYRYQILTIGGVPPHNYNKPYILSLRG